MKNSRIALLGAATALVAGSAFVPAAAFAVPSSASFSATTICPGETVTFTVNGVSDGTQATLPAGETFLVTFNGTPIPTTNTAYTGPYTYQQIVTAGAVGTNVTKIVSDTDPNTVISTFTLEVLAACVTPTPEPAALPNTGTDSAIMTGISAAAVAVALAGAALVVGRRRRA